MGGSLTRIEFHTLAVRCDVGERMLAPTWKWAADAPRTHSRDVRRSALRRRSRRWRSRPRTAPRWPGYQGDGVTLLPNGWRIAPEGRHVTVGDLPMNLVPSPRRPVPRHLHQRLGEAGAQSCSTRKRCRSSAAIADGSHLARPRVAPGRQAAVRLRRRARTSIYEFDVQAGGRLTAAGSISLGPAERHPGGDVIENAGFVAGMAAQRRRHVGSTRRSCTARWCARSIWRTRQVVATAELDGRALHVRPVARRQDAVRLAVGRRQGADARRGDAGGKRRDRGRRASQRDGPVARRRAAVRRLREHQRGLGGRRRRANSQRADLGRARTRRRRSGSTPNGLSLSPDGRTLLIANADNNTVTVADVSKPGWSQVQGLIPARLVSDRRAVRSRRQRGSSCSTARG